MEHAEVKAVASGDAAVLTVPCYLAGGYAMNLNTHSTSGLLDSCTSGIREALSWVPSALAYGAVYYLAVAALVK